MAEYLLWPSQCNVIPQLKPSEKEGALHGQAHTLIQQPSLMFCISSLL